MGMTIVTRPHGHDHTHAHTGDAGHTGALDTDSIPDATMGAGGK